MKQEKQQATTLVAQSTRANRSVIAKALLPAAQRGLEAFAAHPDDVIGRAADSKATVVLLRIDHVQESVENARVEISAEKVEQLAANIRAVGMRDAIEVKAHDDGAYEIVDGHHRLRAARALGWTEIPAWVRDDDELTRAVVRAGKNMARAQLTAYEEARDFKNIMNKGATVEQVAELVGCSVKTVRARLKLLDLPEGVAQLVGQRGITLAYAQELAGLVKVPGADVLIQRALQREMKSAREGPIHDEDLHAIKAEILGGLTDQKQVKKIGWKEEDLVKAYPSLKKEWDALPRVKLDWTTYTTDVQAANRILREARTKQAEKRAKERAKPSPQTDWKLQRAIRDAADKRALDASMRAARSVLGVGEREKILILTHLIEDDGWSRDERIGAIAEGMGVDPKALEKVAAWYGEKGHAAKVEFARGIVKQGDAAWARACVTLCLAKAVEDDYTAASILVRDWIGSSVKDLEKVVAKDMREAEREAKKQEEAAKPKKGAAASTKKKARRGTIITAAPAMVDAPFIKDGYTLYKRDVTLKGGRSQTVYFFSKGKSKTGTPTTLPDGYEVATTTRTGLPVMRRVGATTSKRSSKSGTKAKDLGKTTGACATCQRGDLIVRKGNVVAHKRVAGGGREPCPGAGQPPKKNDDRPSCGVRT